ncbi:class I SAM-dependent methyltransferase [Aurantiacibacter sediminis]|uniref:Class I SAM-dependent methyltransferase n=1 Tax=Aurantiacibacter sediminis TaxID=2793064 RepID=A0ABS0N4I2_9SPHN|nr:class I SAM-dependent methyltransferase [Aurantiacibacter sediminis]MBH5322285.1 class I SAM-dependent methyltransferase [Aurantiacibacter sediminis]
MTDKSEWQGRVGESWAAEYRRTDRSFTMLTEHLLAQTRGIDARHVLDIGCGAGELSLAIARGRSGATVTGLDISADLISIAQERGKELPNCSFTCADAAEWTGNEQANLIVSRHGVMFFDDPVGAFANIAAQTESGGRLLFSCFRDASENPFFHEIRRLLPDAAEKPDPRAPGPFALADNSYVCSVLLQSGWERIEAKPFDFPMIVGSGEDPLEDAVSYFARIGPAARAASEMEFTARERFFDRVRRLAERHLHDGIVSFPAAAWIVTARKV